MASTWNSGQWNLGSWNNAASGAVLASQLLNTSLGSVTVDAIIRTGWNRSTWNSAAWNSAPDAFVSVSTVGQTTIDLNLGFGWNREEWNTGKWNSSLGFVFTGNGNVFATSTAGQLTTSANNITVVANSDVGITCEQLDISQGTETVTGTAKFNITGEELISATVNTFAVAAGGAITINTPTLEANTILNNEGLNVGLATFLDVTGIPISINVGNVSTSTGNIIPITGRGLTANANNISLSTQQILSISGNGVTITSANIVPNSQNFLSITGFQANTNVTTLKFWDPITDNNQENWTNIH